MAHSAAPLPREAEGTTSSAISVNRVEESTSSLPVTRLSVIEGCRQGCNTAWETFFAVYAPLVYRFARHARLADSDAEDVVANVMRNLMKALRGGFEVNHEIGKFRHYLRKVANREINAQRRRAAGVNIDLQDSPEIESAEEHDADWAAAEQRERLRVCLDRLRISPQIGPRDVVAFERYAINGEAAEVVAAELGISRSRLYAIKHEMIQHLRRMKAELDEELGEV